MSTIWTCKVGDLAGDRGALPDGCDQPMRRAVREAYERITGKPDQFCFSGWAGELTESELAVVEDRDPVHSFSPEIEQRIRERLNGMLAVAVTDVGQSERERKLAAWYREDVSLLVSLLTNQERR